MFGNFSTPHSVVSAVPPVLKKIITTNAEIYSSCYHKSRYRRYKYIPPYDTLAIKQRTASRRLTSTRRHSLKIKLSPLKRSDAISDSITSLCKHIEANGFHNRSSFKPSILQSTILTLGFKFIPQPVKSLIPSVIDDFNKFARRLRLRYQFIDQSNSTVTNIQLLLRSKNSSYQPPSASKLIENYISTCREKLHLQLSALSRTSQPSYYDRQSLFESTIYSLTSLDTIMITQADKNMGPVLVDRQWYEMEALRQLSDITTYKRLLILPKVRFLKNSLIEILIKYNKLDDLQLSNFLLRPFDKYTDNDVIPCAYFYMLVKLHKPEPTPISGRPIAACVRSLTYNVSKYLDIYLQPLMKRFSSYLKNPFDIIEILETQSFPQDTVILTGDVNSLYPSIDIADGIVAIQNALRIFTSVPSNSIDFISELLKWVLINNFIAFGDTYWLQIKGTAMGTPVAVTFANIYLSMLEYEFAVKVRSQVITTMDLSAVIIYKRYIDDIFALFKSTEQAKRYSQLFNLLRPGNIKIDFSISNTSGVILDIELFKGSRFSESGFFDITLFQKKCNKYLYIPPFSFHPLPVFKGFINSELQRFRLHCTNDLDFATKQNEFYDHLVKRGYSTSFLDNIFPCISTRLEILEKRR